MLSMLMTACTTEGKKQEDKEEFPVTTVTVKDTFTVTDYVAEIHAKQNVEVRARVGGFLEKLHVDEGAYVRKDQLLFTIDSREYREELVKASAAYKSAAAEVNAAKLELENTKKLAAKNIVSSAEVALAESKVEVQAGKMEEARAQQAYAQLRLSLTEIKAPFDGLINRIPYKVGSLIEEGTLLTTISECDKVFAYFDVSEKQYLQYLRTNGHNTDSLENVTLLLADGSEHKYKGRIETIEGAIDPATGNIAFRASFDNSGNILKHGASGKVRLSKKYKDAILVPQRSTFEIQEKIYVYVVDSQNRIRQQNIEVEDRLPHLFIVKEGLKPGDRIVYEGVQNASQEMAIRPFHKTFDEIITELRMN